MENKISRSRRRTFGFPTAYFPAVVFFLLLLFGIVFQHFAKADDNFVQITAEGTSSATDAPKARTESLSDAITKGSLQVIGQLIGESKLDKNMPVIKSKILPLRQKFVQFYKASEPVKKGADSVTTVNMKISITSLRDLLAAEGLLYQSEGPATILPVVRITEKRDNGRQYRWWTEEATSANSFLREQERMGMRQFENLFRAKNFYFIDPIGLHYVQWMPQPYRIENPTLDDLTWMGTFFKAQMVMSGDVVLEPGTTPGAVRSTIKVVGYNTQNGRVVGEVTRSFETVASDWDLGVQQTLRNGFKEVAKDFTSQVMDEWTRGTFGASLVRVSLHGNFNYQDLEAFKKQITAKVGDVKKIIERRLEKGNATFEVDAAGGVSTLAKHFETTPFEGFKVGVQDLSPNQVDLRFSK